MKLSKSRLSASSPCRSKMISTFPRASFVLRLGFIARTCDKVSDAVGDEVHDGVSGEVNDGVSDDASEEVDDEVNYGVRVHVDA